MMHILQHKIIAAKRRLQSRKQVSATGNFLISPTVKAIGSSLFKILSSFFPAAAPV